MGKIRSLLKNVRLKYRRSSTLTKTVVMSTIGVGMVARLMLHVANDADKKRLEAKRQQAAQLEQENADLKDKNNAQGSLEGAEQIAKDDLGMADPSMVGIIPNTTPDE